jgi:hypothetical protein
VRLRNPFPSFMPTKTGLTHEETASIAGASSESAKVLNDDFDHMARFALEAIVGSMHKNIPSILVPRAYAGPMQSSGNGR